MNISLLFRPSVIRGPCLEQLKFKLEKIFGIEKHAGKVRKVLLLAFSLALLIFLHCNYFQSQEYNFSLYVLQHIYSVFEE